MIKMFGGREISKQPMCADEWRGGHTIVLDASSHRHLVDKIFDTDQAGPTAFGSTETR